MYVLTSSSDNQLSYELDGDVKHGVFTFYLIELDKPAAPAADVTLYEAFSYARRMVSGALPKSITQQPKHWIGGNIDQLPWLLSIPSAH